MSIWKFARTSANLFSLYKDNRMVVTFFPADLEDLSAAAFSALADLKLKDETPLTVDLDCSLHDEQSKCVCELGGSASQHPLCGLAYSGDADGMYCENKVTQDGNTFSCAHDAACHGAEP